MFWALLSYLGPPELPGPGVTRPPWSYLAPMELPALELPGPRGATRPWSYLGPWSWPGPGATRPGVTWAPRVTRLPELPGPRYPAPPELPGPSWSYPAPGVTRSPGATRLPLSYPAPWSYPAPRSYSAPPWLALGQLPGCSGSDSYHRESSPRTSLHPSLCAAHSLPPCPQSTVSCATKTRKYGFYF